MPLGLGLGLRIRFRAPASSLPAGVVGWWKADDLSKVVTSTGDGDGTGIDGSPVDGHFVYTWSDSNGGAIEWGPDVGASPKWYAASTINGGLPGVRFTLDAAYRHLSTTQLSSLSLTAAEVFIVVKATAALGGKLWAIGTSDDEWFPYVDGTGYEDFGSSNRPAVGSLTPTTALVYGVATSATEFSVYVDGTQLYTTGTNTVAWRATSLLGRDAAAGNTYQGDVGEMIIFDHVLSSGDRAIVNAYLRARWGTP